MFVVGRSWIVLLLSHSEKHMKCFQEFDVVDPGSSVFEITQQSIYFGYYYLSVWTPQS